MVALSSWGQLYRYRCPVSSVVAACRNAAVEHVGTQLKRVRTSRKSLEGETRGRPGRELSREVLARRTGNDVYPTVAAATIKSAEESPVTGARLPGDDTIASLYSALKATAEEFPAGALADARYLANRWLDERLVGVDVALRRREQMLALIGDKPSVTERAREAAERLAGTPPTSQRKPDAQGEGGTAP